LDSLFIVVAIVIGLLNFAAKQQQQKQKESQGQGNMSRQQNQRKQSPDQWQKHIPQQPERTVRDMGSSWEEGLKDAVEYMPVSMPDSYTEGVETENRGRAGSMDYIEQSQSSEGICNEHPEHRRQKTKEKKAAPKAEVIEIEEDIIFNLTEDDLMRSIVMAEVLGPPRAIKRRIR